MNSNYNNKSRTLEEINKKLKEIITGHEGSSQSMTTFIMNQSQNNYDNNDGCYNNLEDFKQFLEINGEKLTEEDFFKKKE